MSDKPVVTQEGTKVIIECHTEKAGETCYKEITKVLKNRMLAFMMRRHMKK